MGGSRHPRNGPRWPQLVRTLRGRSTRSHNEAVFIRKPNCILTLPVVQRRQTQSSAGVGRNASPVLWPARIPSVGCSCLKPHAGHMAAGTEASAGRHSAVSGVDSAGGSTPQAPCQHLCPAPYLIDWLLFLFIVGGSQSSMGNSWKEEAKGEGIQQGTALLAGCLGDGDGEPCPSLMVRSPVLLSAL